MHPAQVQPTMLRESSMRLVPEIGLRLLPMHCTKVEACRFDIERTNSEKAISDVCDMKVA